MGAAVRSIVSDMAATVTLARGRETTAVEFGGRGTRVPAIAREPIGPPTSTLAYRYSRIPNTLR